MPGRHVFPHLLAQGEIPVSGSVHPLRWLPPSRENKNWTGGDPSLHLSQMRGHSNSRICLPALLGGKLGCWIFQFPLILHSLWGVSEAAYIMTLGSYSVLDILLPTIIIIMQECSQALKICKCLWSVSYGGVYNMMLILSITFHCHYYMYVYIYIYIYMYIYGLYVFNWPISV